jgi:hypothetical protein
VALGRSGRRTKLGRFQHSVHRQAVLAERAREMRLSPTTSEWVLWQAIRGRRLGVQFRRQVPLGGRYIADFFASELGSSSKLTVATTIACVAVRMRAGISGSGATATRYCGFPSRSSCAISPQPSRSSPSTSQRCAPSALAPRRGGVRMRGAPYPTLQRCNDPLPLLIFGKTPVVP